MSGARYQVLVSHFDPSDLEKAVGVCGHKHTTALGARLCHDDYTSGGCSAWIVKTENGEERNVRPEDFCERKEPT